MATSALLYRLCTAVLHVPRRHSKLCHHQGRPPRDGCGQADDGLKVNVALAAVCLFVWLLGGARGGRVRGAHGLGGWVCEGRCTAACDKGHVVWEGPA